MWDIKLKLVDIDNTMVVTQRERVWGVLKGKGSQIYGDNLTLSGGHTMKYKDHVS